MDKNLAFQLGNAFIRGFVCAHAFIFNMAEDKRHYITETLEGKKVEGHWVTLKGLNTKVFFQKGNDFKNEKIVAGAGASLKKPKDLSSVINTYRDQVEASHLKKGYSIFLNQIKKVKKAKALKSLLREVATNIKGIYSGELKDLGKFSVTIDDLYVAHCLAPLYRNVNFSFRKKIEVAKQMVFILCNLKSIINKGYVLTRRNNTIWRNDPKHHPDLDFLTINAKLPVKNRILKVSIDICRKHVAAKGLHLYHTNYEDHPTWQDKMRNFTHDSAETYKLWDIRFE